ncbi:transposase [Streptomyces sp. QH1-20]|uniref:transposase n=1 Tax=Streptomyces sp. QH1-20 TaxID=3240934 RepID=UPI00351514CC
MGRPPALPADEKFTLVLGVLTGEETAAEAARRAGVSEQSVWNWRRQFIEAGRLGLTGEVMTRDAARADDMSKEISTLKTTIGELYVELRRHRDQSRRRIGTPDGLRVNHRVVN